MDRAQQEIGSVSTAQVSEPSPVSSLQRKRSLMTSPVDSVSDTPENRRKAHKVSRACDLCKAKKARCTGTRPCENCTRKGVPCVYDAKYSRGRPPTPPSAPSVNLTERLRGEMEIGQVINHPGDQSVGLSGQDNRVNSRLSSVPSTNNQASGTESRLQSESTSITPTKRITSRASPELEMAEIEGQYFDPTSGLTFLHRAWKRLSTQKGKVVPDVLNDAEKRQPLMTAGDKPFDIGSENSLLIPDKSTAMELLAFYFDVCIVTYRFLHRHTVLTWLETVEANVQRSMPMSHGLGHAKAAIVLTILAIATSRQAKLRGANASEDEALSLRRSDQFFCAATSLTEAETGLPKLESAQARLIQVLYLLQTSRMNQGWYVFGNTLQIISALGLHRRAGRIRNSTSKGSHVDYITSQCRKRTFWVAYTIDKYLGVVLGRPRHYHDDDIDQDFPDRVNDEDMTPQGPSTSEALHDCHIDSLVFHAKLAQIIGNISGEVYSIKCIPKHERVAAAHHLGRELHGWRASLPPHLGTIRPSSLIPSFRRQATALKLAYSHAIMHANRPFLLGNVSSQSEAAALGDSVVECISAAKVALETVDSMASDDTLFHAFWWTQYVIFCALTVVYVWEIQQSANGNITGDDESRVRLFDLAERNQSHLARAMAANSPSGRYSIILEELRLEAKHQSARSTASRSLQVPQQRTAPPEDISHGLVPGLHPSENLDLGQAYQDPGETNYYGMHNLLNEWETTDWLDLDSSAFCPFSDFDGSPALWLPDVA